MSTHIIDPFHVATALSYALNKGEFKSLAGNYISYLQSLIKAQYQPHGTLLMNDENYSESDREFLVILELSDFYDSDFEKKSNIKKLAELIYKANFDAVDERYSEHNQDYLDGLNRNPMGQLSREDYKLAQAKANELDIFQFICMIDYMNYQCSAHSNYKNSICCKFLDSLVYNAIRNHESYKKFDWGISKS